MIGYNLTPTLPYVEACARIATRATFEQVAAAGAFGLRLVIWIGAEERTAGATGSGTRSLTPWTGGSAIEELAGNVRQLPLASALGVFFTETMGDDRLVAADHRIKTIAHQVGETFGGASGTQEGLARWAFL